MKKKLLVLFSLFGLSSLQADFKSLTTKEVVEAMKKGIEIIDVRRQEEWEHYGIIKGSHKLTFFDNAGRYNLNNWLQEFNKIVKNKNQAFILVCAHANRTKVIGQILNKELYYKNVYELDGGIVHGWINKGKDVIR